MKRSLFALSILMLAILGWTAFALAEEAAVFDATEQINIRAYTSNKQCTGTDKPCLTDLDCSTGTCVTDPAKYSAYLEIRDADGNPVDSTTIQLNPVAPLGTPPLIGESLPGSTCVPATPAGCSASYVLHGLGDLLEKPDVSVSLNADTGTTYVFCTNGNLHVMMYNIVNTNRPVDGSCGSADGVASYNAPQSNLCGDSSTPSVSDNGSGQWEWTCAGKNGGLPATCRATIKKDGACGGARNGNYYDPGPTSGLCGDGSTPPVSKGGGQWTWTCAGAGGGNPAYCSANVEADGKCGVADGLSFTTAPTTNLCADGAVPTVNGTGPWSWTCPGTNGGQPANCSAQILKTYNIDLQITRISGMATGGLPGLGVAPSITVKNNGSDASGAYKVNVYILMINPGASNFDPANYAQDCTGGVNVNCKVASASYTGLLGGQTVLDYMRFTIPQGLTLHRYYYLFFVVDGDNQVTETNEGNNVMYRSFFTQ